jgi:hypothetical protein
MGVEEFTGKLAWIVEQSRLPVVTVGYNQMGVGFGAGLPLFLGGNFPVSVRISLAGGDEGSKVDVWQEVESFGISLKIPSQRIV